MPGIWREWGLKEGLSPWSSILGTHHTVFRLGGGAGEEGVFFAERRDGGGRSREEGGGVWRGRRREGLNSIM